MQTRKRARSETIANEHDGAALNFIDIDIIIKVSYL